MHKHWDFRPSMGAPDTASTSCLTINEPAPSLGLNNLLDLVSHEISQDNDKQIHRLTFKSGETLYIKANSRAVTVRGSRINFDANTRYPSTTYLNDPAIRE